MRQIIEKILGVGGTGRNDSQRGSEQVSSSKVPHAAFTLIDTQLPICPEDRKSERCFPKGNLAETRIAGVSLHATTKSLFENSEILNVLLRPEEFNILYPDPRGANFHPLKAGQLQDNRQILQQVGWRGSLQACIEMIKIDHDLPPIVQALKDAGFRPQKEALNDFARVGLQSSLHEIRFNEMSVSELQKPLAALAVLESALKKSGSLILVLSTEIGEHALILDKLDMKHNSAVLREPFHGWAIEISLDALKERFKLGFDYIAVNKAA